MNTIFIIILLLIVCNVITGGGLIYFIRLYKKYLPYKDKYLNLSAKTHLMCMKIDHRINSHFTVIKISKRIGRIKIIEELSEIIYKLSDHIDYGDIDIIKKINEYMKKINNKKEV